MGCQTGLLGNHCPDHRFVLSKYILWILLLPTYSESILDYGLSQFVHYWPRSHLSGSYLPLQLWMTTLPLPKCGTLLSLFSIWQEARFEQDYSLRWVSRLYSPWFISWLSYRYRPTPIIPLISADKSPSLTNGLALSCAAGSFIHCWSMYICMANPRTMGTRDIWLLWVVASDISWFRAGCGRDAFHWIMYCLWILAWESFGSWSRWRCV